MQLPSSPATLAVLVLAPLILWRMYSRVRRMIGRQKLSKWRARLTLFFFPLLTLLVAVTSLGHPELLLALGVAAIAGIALSVYGIRKTTFESPLTLAIFGLLAGYYVGYALQLLSWRRRVLKAKAEREAASATDS